MLLTKYLINIYLSSNSCVHVRKHQLLSSHQITPLIIISDHVPPLSKETQILHHPVVLPFWSYHHLHQNIWCTQALSKHLLVYHCQISHTTLSKHLIIHYSYQKNKNIHYHHHLTLPYPCQKHLTYTHLSKHLIWHHPSQNNWSHTNPVKTCYLTPILLKHLIFQYSCMLYNKMWQLWCLNRWPYTTPLKLSDHALSIKTSNCTPSL